MLTFGKTYKIIICLKELLIIYNSMLRSVIAYFAPRIPLLTIKLICIGDYKIFLKYIIAIIYSRSQLFPM